MCPLCCQEEETVEHMMIQCSYAREIWYHLLLPRRMHRHTPTANSQLASWWPKLSNDTPKADRKEVNSLVILIARNHMLESQYGGIKEADFVRNIHVKTKELIEKKGKNNAARVNKKRKEILFKLVDTVWVHFRKDRFPKLRKSKLLPRGADLGASRSTPFEGVGGDDEDIPTTLLPPSLQDEDDAVVKLKSNEVRIGPIARARAKLLKEQVNLFLSDTLINENFIQPKSYYLCMIRYGEGASIARGEEKQLDVKLDLELDMTPDMKTSYGSAREERETS
ncbi:hypothetical protein QYE76_016926 [Lolium multiflorum]|uniref:Reverse transcriptase zinc-binding domain-containing protein n=1 Tax=Lolium multiflorum TaxID=4521 RepID=A0AAD8V570_LOLMU|nr:hypothetical protein QYE76_016926 [Lolium multiflorum]